jgi:hypothetical protein
MAGLGYAAVVQARAAASGSDFMLALFYRPDRLRLAWSEERSRALLAALEVTAEGPARGQVGGRAAHRCRRLPDVCLAMSWWPGLMPLGSSERGNKQ